MEPDRLPGAGFAAALMLTVVLVVWLGLAGPVDINKVKDWQTLIGALAAIAVAFVAWSASQRTSRINLLIREEDRLEQRLPGIEDAIGFLEQLVTPAARQPAAFWLAIFEALAIPSNTLDIGAAVERALPVTANNTRREIALRLRLLSVCIERLSRAQAPRTSDEGDELSDDRASELGRAQRSVERAQMNLFKISHRLTFDRDLTNARLAIVSNQIERYLKAY